MSEQLLAVLRLCLLGLMYLFFLRVLRAVWVEMRGPRPARVSALVDATSQGHEQQSQHRAPAAPPPTGSVLRVVEPESLANRTYPIGAEVTIGRAAGCGVVLDDTYISQLHARVYATEAGYVVEDLGSTNGSYVNGTKVTNGVLFAPGDRLQVGNVVMVLS